ncbi:MAG TPA: HAMP domain-containing sensor histidine kinase [Ktedonobacterales bacterium]|nr:HAMP domain-containing sensor histidine kinase [Ktedonobacterales bacterium]
MGHIWHRQQRPGLRRGRRITTTLRSAGVRIRSTRTLLRVVWRAYPRPRATSGAGTVRVFAALAYASALLICFQTLQPAPWQLLRVVCSAALSGLLSLGLGMAVLRLTERTAATHSIWVKFAAPMLLSVFLVTLNVWLLAWLVFRSRQDIQLLLALLLFSVTAALAISLPIARRATEAIARMEADARRIALGEYGVRLVEGERSGGQELTQLAHWYNLMSARLADALATGQAAEIERRQVIKALSHDLRTPLTAIQMMIEAMADGVVTDPLTVQRYHQTIQAEAYHLAALVNGLFELARLEAGTLPLDRERLPIQEVVEDTVASLQASAGQAGVRLASRAEGPSRDGALDVELMSRALRTLVRSALERTPAGGVVLVLVTPEQLVLGEAAVTVRILDTGEGVPPHELPHLFTPMYRADAARTRQVTPASSAVDGASEAGLGLAIAARIIEAHGGRVEALSPLPPDLRELVGACDTGGSANIGPGAALCVSLPVATDADPPVSVPSDNGHRVA